MTLPNSQPRSWYHFLLRHPIIETLATIVAATAAYFPPFSDPKTSLLVAVIGSFFCIGRYGITELLKELHAAEQDALATRFERVNRLAEVVDLSTASDSGKLRALCDRYFQIADHEFHQAKDDIVSTALARLNVIVQERRTEKLTTGAYYEFLSNLLASVKTNETVYAVSTGESIEWDESPQEERFFEANKQIVSRGGTVIRIFVYSKSAFESAVIANKKIAAHFNGKAMTGLFLDKDSLTTSDRRLLNAIGQGFLMVERRIAVVDVFGDEPRGYVTKNKDEIARYLNAVNQLRELASDGKHIVKSLQEATNSGQKKPNKAVNPSGGSGDS